MKTLADVMREVSQRNNLVRSGEFNAEQWDADHPRATAEDQKRTPGGDASEGTSIVGVGAANGGSHAESEPQSDVR